MPFVGEDEDLVEVGLLAVDGHEGLGLAVPSTGVTRITSCAVRQRAKPDLDAAVGLDLLFLESVGGLLEEAAAGSTTGGSFSRRSQ